MLFRVATTSQIRAWWKPWRCQPTKFTKVVFPGTEKYGGLSVANTSAPVWRAVAQIMASEPYTFREPAGGTYVCRPIGTGTSYSLHAYALALDLNPSKNPHRRPLKTDMPKSFITRMEGIRANGKQAITWGGDWTIPDAMHFQIDVAPADCKNVTWDQGGAGETTPEGGGEYMGNWKQPGDPVVDNDDMHKVHGWQGNDVMTDADIDYDENDPKLLDERIKMLVTKVVNVMMK